MSDFAKTHQIRFQLGLRFRLRWGSSQRSPDLLAGFEGPTSKRSRNWGGRGVEKQAECAGKKWAGKGTKGKGRRRGICLLSNLGLATPLVRGIPKMRRKWDGRVLTTLTWQQFGLLVVLACSQHRSENLLFLCLNFSPKSVFKVLKNLPLLYICCV